MILHKPVETMRSGVASDNKSGYLDAFIGVSPSGKASVFGIDIPRFESWHPSQKIPHVPVFRLSDGRNVGVTVSHLLPSAYQAVFF